MLLKSTVWATLAATAVFTLAAPALAEPTSPVVIGWWSYFDNTKVDTTTSPAHAVTMFGDPDTYYYEPSGGHGLLEDPTALPTPQAWQSMISFILSKSNGATLSSSFSIATTSDLNELTQAYYGWAFALLYVPKDQYCDSYKLHIGTADDGVQAMVNAKIVGYAVLGEQNKYIDMVEYNTSNLVLRPGINEIVLIHEDQAKVERYVKDVWIEHQGQQVPLAPKDIAWGRAFDAGTQAPIYKAQVGISGNGVTDTFTTGPFGFYFFSGLADGAYALTSDAGGYKPGMASVSVALGQGATEVVRTDLGLDPGCSCPSGKACGPSGGCLDPCQKVGEFGETCAEAGAVCVNHVCVKSPCDTLHCAPGFACQNVQQGTPPTPAGICVELACSNICCGPGQVCSAGACVTDNCSGGCALGQACAGGACVDACAVLICEGQLVCKVGVCIDPCDANPSSCGAPDGGIGIGGDNGAGGNGAGGKGSGSDSTTSAGNGGSGANGASSGESSGCGCRVGGDGKASGLAALGLGLAALATARRRRRG